MTFCFKQGVIFFAHFSGPEQARLTFFLVTGETMAVSGKAGVMTDNERESIREMRLAGDGYKAIAAKLGLSLSTVKSYCRRAGLSGDATKAPVAMCLQCGKPLTMVPGKKHKKFCSDVCRFRWWNAHRERLKRTVIHTVVCAGCGREFTIYGSTGRKYCSHSCYIKARFGGQNDEDGRAENGSIRDFDGHVPELDETGDYLEG